MLTSLLYPSVHRRTLGITAAICASLSISACSRSTGVGALASPAVMPASAQTPSHLRIYDTKRAQFVSFAQLADAASRADVVFFGEQHDDPATHAAELAVLAALGERRRHVIVTMEMFERDVQLPLDRYLTGALNEDRFLADARPWDRYATDYRGLVELARIRGWSVVAANVPRRIASAVSRKGLAVLDTMNATERGYAAKSNECPKDAYYTKFSATMSGHGAGNGPPSAADADAARVITDRFYEAQCVKDEAMGESIANAFSAAGGKSIVFQVDGAFHSDQGYGTAARVKRRLPSAKTVVLSAVPLADPAVVNVSEYANRADFVLFTRAPLPTAKK